MILNRRAVICSHSPPPAVRLVGQKVGIDEPMWIGGGSGWDAKTDAQLFPATPGILRYFLIKVDWFVTIRGGIYSNNPEITKPGALLGSTQNHACIPGWNTIPFVYPVTLEDDDYWLAWKMDGGYILNILGAGPTVSCADSNFTSEFPEAWVHEYSVVRDWAVSGWGHVL